MAAIGKLDRRITLQRLSSVNTPLGPEEATTELGKVWASRTDVSDGERALANTVQGTVVARYVVRASPLTSSLQPKDQLRAGGRLFAITGIKEKGRSHFEITAEGRMD